ncbi:hypothetical protein CBL_02865 [Carabus blaptoides fortunei]
MQPDKFGLTPSCFRKLAYQCAILHDIKMPQSWIENEKAGVEWFNAFLKRNPKISIRQPEATSLARATSFNKTNVEQFFNKLSDVLSRDSFESSDIWNMDETGMSTILHPNKILAQKGVKQIGAITSAERGEMVTVTAAVNAQGNSIPVMFIFPRKKFRDHFIRDGPPGCIGRANGIVKQSFLSAAVHANIISGFTNAGIFPFNPNNFSESDFAPASVTDRPNPHEEVDSNEPGCSGVHRPDIRTTSSEEIGTASSANLTLTPVKTPDNNIEVVSVSTTSKANRVLWDKKCDDYKNISLIDKMWEEIGQQCSLTGKEAAALFSSLRLKYIRRKNEEKNMQRNDTILPRKTVSNLLKEKSIVLKNTPKTSSEGIDVYSNEPLQGCSGLFKDCNVSLASDDFLPIMSPPPTTDAQNRCITPVSTTPTPSTSGTSLSDTILRKPTKRRHEKTGDVYRQIAETISASITFARESEVTQEVEHFCNVIGARLTELPKKKKP